MSRSRLARRGVLALALSGLLASAPALAEKPDFAGGGKGGKPEQHEKHDKRDAGAPREKGNRDVRNQRDADNGRNPGRPDDRGVRDRDDRTDRDQRDRRRESVREHRYFEDRQRVVVRNYYAEEFRRGHCPPGLAKKRNGCMPPGLAKRWRIGERLPRDVVYYDLPSALLLELGHAPTMHKYVRVGADILLIALGTGLVVDALEDLSGM